MTQVNEVKIGFVVRQQLKEANKHSIVSVETYSIKDMKSIINFK